jgi:hypothetical protein
MDQEQADYAEPGELCRRRLTLVEIAAIIAGILAIIYVAGAVLRELYTMWAMAMSQ